MVGWPPPAARHPPRCSLIPPPQQDRRRKYHGKAHGQDKGKDISYQLLSQAKQTQLELGKFTVLPSNIKLDGEKQRKKLKYLLPTPCFSQVQIHFFIPDSSPFSPNVVLGMGHGAHGQFRTVLLCCCILLTLPCSSVGPLLGLQSFRINLLQHGSTKGCSSHQNLLQCGLPIDCHGCTCLHRISAPPSHSPWAAGARCLTTIFTMGCQAISASAPAAPPLLLFRGPLLSAGLFVSLVFQIPRAAVWHFALSCTLFPRGATTLAVGLLLVLWWVGRSRLELSVSGAGQVQLLLTWAIHSPLCHSKLPINTQVIALNSVLLFRPW